MVSIIFYSIYLQIYCINVTQYFQNLKKLVMKTIMLKNSSKMSHYSSNLWTIFQWKMNSFPGKKICYSVTNCIDSIQNRPNSFWRPNSAVTYLKHGQASSENGKVKVGQLQVCQTHYSYPQTIFPASFVGQGISIWMLRWLDGARSPTK